MTMKNGKVFYGKPSGQAILPMLHLKEAGFEFTIATPTGKPVIFEMWAMPREDKKVLDFYKEYKSKFEKPVSVSDFVINSLNDENYSAIFVPGGHGAMLGIPEDRNVGKVLRWAHEKELYTITLVIAYGSLLSTALDANELFIKAIKWPFFLTL